MSELRLSDLWVIVKTLGLIGALAFTIAALIAAWPYIRQFASAVWHRFVTFEWHGIMSSIADQGGSEPVREYDQTGVTWPVRGHQHQIAPNELLENEPTRELPYILSSDEAFARTLARLRKPDQSYWLSANKIVSIVGGTEARVKGWVADERPDVKPPQVARSIYRPRNGWQA